VEIASPDQSRPEMAAKAKLWLDAGVRLLWVIWPASQQVDVWRTEAPGEAQTLESSEALEGGDVLPGFAYPLEQLWR
jgi:Uma2 family endonuclease